MFPFWFEPGAWVVNPGGSYDSSPLRRRYKFPIEVEAGVIVEINGECHLALAKTKATPIELSHCRACSLFRKPICELLKCEKLQQISEEDMIKEGVIRYAKPFDNNPYLVERFTYRTPGVNHTYNSPLMAFLRIIGDIFGKDTWLNNPYRISYEFTLIK